MGTFSSPQRLHSMHDSRWGRALHRLTVAYWILFCVPLLAGELPLVDGLDSWYERGFTWLAIFVGRHLLHVTRPIPTQQTGSGDMTRDWLRLFLTVLLALVATVVWTILDGERRRPRLDEATRILVRYSLALVMLGYGVIKLTGGQFPANGPPRLLERFGDASPMGLLWAFMGASKPYVIFSGAGETLGAVLLLFRRTTTLGALVLIGVLTNVVVLNFCYDVPVKINSTHYLWMALWLAAADAGRLANVLLFNRATAPAERRLVLPARWMRITRAVAKLAVVGGALVSLGLMLRGELSSYSEGPSAGPGGWIEGYWDVARFTRGGADVPAIITDATRWRRLRLVRDEGKLYLRWKNMDDSPGALFVATLDETAHTLALAPDEGEKGATAKLTLQERDSDHFTLSGTVGNDALTVELARLEVGKLLLTSRGFHFINEEPFNR
jgi:uncharacterized membrane protein YphA (DoxX/SURF4 family)